LTEHQQGPAPAGQRSAPGWLQPLLDAVAGSAAQDFSRWAPPARGGRESAVLVLFGAGEAGPDLLFIERSADLREHAGQPAFPGVAADPGDAGPAATALREAAEETGLDPDGVDVLAVLPSLWLPPTGFVVAPVLAFWREPCGVAAVDPAEVAAVARVPVRELADPANRVRLRHPSGVVGPAFEARGLLVWGFTAGLVDRLLAFGGWERPWDHERYGTLPETAARLAEAEHSRRVDRSP
jgi:8-oxo-dGTP pyrophosphatase MutT (NUDIX family)